MRKSTGTLNGSVMANGLPCGPDFRRISAYVPQASTPGLLSGGHCLHLTGHCCLSSARRICQSHMLQTLTLISYAWQCSSNKHN